MPSTDPFSSLTTLEATAPPHRAPQAWQKLMHVQFVAVPNALRRSQAARRRMRQLRKRVRR